MSVGVCAHVRVNAQYLLQMNVLVDNSLVPLWVHGLLGIPGPSFVISTVKWGYAEILTVSNKLKILFSA